MTEKPNKPIERAAGTAATIITAAWGFKGFLAVIDWISRAETTAVVVPYLWVVGTPAGFLVEFIVGVLLLIYATSLERSRERDATPRIIRAWSDPPTPKRNRVWIKLACFALLASAASAASVFIIIQHHKPPVIVNSGQPPAGRQVAPAETANLHPTKSISTVKSALAPHRVSKNSANPSAMPGTAQVTLEIPTPNFSQQQLREQTPQVLRATIGGKEVSGNTKQPGTLYLAIRLSEVSQYRGALNQQDLEAVKVALESTKKLSVFEGELALLGANNRT
jgi:hypothetical protein